MDILDDESKTWWLICPSNHTKRLKLTLEKLSLYNHQRKILPLEEDNGKLAIPLKYEKFQDVLNKDEELKSIIEDFNVTIELKYLPPQKSNKLKPRDKLCESVRELFLRKGLVFKEDLYQDLPSHWEKHGDLVLLSDQCFLSEEWLHVGNELWTVTAEALGAKRLGKKSAIRDNDFRSPSVCLLSGVDGWVSHVDNGITYTYDVTKCMFSSGNITEKIRVGALDCSGQTVVDLYAGIGYFVLPYLVHAGASILYACEWNPHALVALRRNLAINQVDKRCTVYEGDNKMFPHKGIADHVNLGLIPSSEGAWPVACAALHSDHGGWLHIHGNVASSKKTTDEDQIRTQHTP
ncbi:tRNA wybutosine-synthesizing protein 2 homolog isoform X2 [Actinia tenebrosa]|uniref:tRNA(Phe) (4-demethylwyosine(37)-C(7)) aminocarboxypropyltransferase n=1 Tax=Actinia tenebrosa TaxID=6105 RepID=A0A6P8I2K5_ACTTE|nr:tRNA wybutosine-synthesizing protein 2 homolog isoform X2 [Actinia tenebrosa]